MLFYYALATITAYILLWIGYQVFLHPLSKYPGPFLAKLSNVYNGYYAWKRCLHLTTLKNQQKYDIYKTDRTTKTKDYMALGPNLSIHTIFTVVDKTAHRHRRRLIGSVLSDRSMRTFEPTINTQANIFLQTLSSKSKQSQPVNMSQETRRYGMNIAALLAFGYDLRLQTDEENLFLLTVLDVGTFANSFLLQFPFLREWGLGVLLMLPAFRVVEKYFVLVERLITARTALAKDAKHDLYSFVADSLGVEGEEGIRKSELWAEANIFLAAGSFIFIVVAFLLLETRFSKGFHNFPSTFQRKTDTSSLILRKTQLTHPKPAGDTTRTALSATFFYLSRNPSSYQRLAAEIRSTFTSGDEICGAKLGSCVYLRACIDEALRLASPVSGILVR
ncbi:hypothetical protein HYFRA_00013182 [Hymenoscyphus fraxineus]|uniref:Cytochrome P450 n=1 Tax=Hymenoscyphus fraxineus TaxID=746836 RepID=A0A9N9L906_9HELO|nr:hypothetical protein HYFRA_00013182 [Hymenoscyphus fraxineus]